MYRLKLLQHGSEIKELQLESGREYTFGRAESCDVQLSEQSGISRVHFKLVEEAGQWTAQVMSKFGDLRHAGLPVQQLVLEPGSVFKLGNYDFLFLDAAPEPAATPSSSNMPVPLAEAPFPLSGDAASHSPEANRLAPSSVPSMAGSAMNSPADFEGNDESTRVAIAERECPFLRVLDIDGKEKVIKLEGRRWIAGREEGNDILLDDRKASRRQFELSSTPQGYFIRDLGSSNGTLLNGTPLAADELKAIRSGDVIQVGRVVMHFEMRDPDFTKRLMVVSPQIEPDAPILVQSPYEMINYPVAMGPGGAVRIDPAAQTGNLLARLESIPIPFTENLDDARRKKVRFWILAAVALLPIVLVLLLTGEPPPSKPKAPANAAFEKLTPQKQQEVKELYRTSKDLFIQSKLALADQWLKKLHEILPEGYEDSLKLAEECQRQAENERQIRELEERERQLEEIKRTVEKTMRDCEPLSKRSFKLEEITSCLEPALQLDPDNPRMRELIGNVERRIEQRKMEELQRKDYQARAAKGNALYQRALALEIEGDYVDALEAYQKHAESPYPDPEGLKANSQRQIISLRKKMGAKVEEAIRAAESAYAVNKYREALDHVARAKKYDPRNNFVAELNGKYRREIALKMRAKYEEAVISEGLGDVEAAKVIWKEILDTDHPDGEYYKKARNKLKAYGNL